MEKRFYELSYLITPEIDPLKNREFVDEIEKSVSEKGEIVNVIPPKKIKLSYPIKKQKEGYLATVEFYCQPQNIESIKKALEKNENILRFIIFKKGKQKSNKSENPQQLPKLKEEAEEKVEK